MKFVENNIRGVRVWQVGSWLERGLSHGFFGADLDLQNGVGNWNEHFPSCELRLLKQVSADSIAQFDTTEELPIADGWQIDLSNAEQSFGIRTADCVPAILVSFAEEKAFLLHLGWKGIDLGLLEKGLSQFADKTTVEIALGPSCGGENYEVEGWLANKLEKHSKYQEKAKIFLDLRKLLTKTATQAGIQPALVYNSGLCTISDKRFFSFRRQKEHAGRQVSVLAGNII